MINIMLVDDEVLALDYLKNMVDWEKHGYHIVGCVNSGKKALELYGKAAPEIVISDIRMPVMDGLELTRRLKEKNKDVVVILLSAYKDFEYAKKGIQYGVSNYLLKHELSEEIMLEELARVREQLKKAHRDQKIYQKYFMNQLIYNQNSGDSVEKESLGSRLFLMLIHKRNPAARGEFLEVEWNAKEQEILEQVLETGLEQIVSYVADVQITANNWMVLYRIDNIASKYTINRLIERKTAQIIDKLEGMPDCRFNIIYSYEITPEEISVTFRKMSRQIRYVVFWRVNRGCPVWEIPREEQKMVWGEEIRFLRDSVYEKNGNPREVVGTLFESLCYEERLEACRSLMHLLNNLIREICKTENIHEKQENQKLYTMEEIVHYYEDCFTWLHEKVMETEEMGCSRPVADMIRYIRKKYRQELSLEILGEEFQMNGVYLGQMFKKETGITFLKYLTNVRIEEAKRLLREENCTVSETAERVGYRTSQYFSQIFTRTVGMKPQEYKKWKERD